MKMVIRQKSNPAVHAIVCAIGFLCASHGAALAEIPYPQNKPWRSHSTITVQEPAAKAPAYAADMPVQNYRPTPHIDDSRTNHYPDPFARKPSVEGDTPTVALNEESSKTGNMAKQSPFPDKPLEFMLIDMNLRDFLQDLTKENGNFSLSMGRDIDGQIKNARMTGSMEDILQKLAREFNFDWIVDGPELVLASRAKSEMKVIKDKRLTDEQFRETVADLYSPNLNYMVKNNRMNSSIDIRGPKDFVKRFEQRFEATDSRQVKIIRRGRVFDN